MEEIKKCVICGEEGGVGIEDGLYIVKTRDKEYAYHIHHTNGIKHLKEEDFEGRFLTVTTPSGVVYYMREEFGVPFVEKIEDLVEEEQAKREAMARQQKAKSELDKLMLDNQG